MEGDGGENTGVPCLAVVRYALATVVGVVTFSVVVMVITVVRRPEDIKLSIDHGYITARGLEAPELGHSGLPEVDVQQSNFSPQHNACHGRRRLSSTTNNTANNQSNTTLRVVFTTSNPSGRGDVICSHITGSLLDVMLESSSSTPGMETIVQFHVDNPFDLPKESTHVQPKWVPIEGEDQRRYISERYSSVMIFKVAVMVNMYVSPRNNKRSGYNYTFYCWPIIVGSGYSDLDSTSDVPCNKMANRDIPQLRHFPALEPAPAPTS